ncbi:MAG: hypothetical protein Q3976_06315 [Corynebacterium sp.]|nr:hypothetical protein [Corynebacterium sp.]
MMAPSNPAVLAHIDAFMHDMETFAAGSYLSEQEREHWTAPFDVASLPELRTLLEGICTDIGQATSDEDVRIAIRSFEARLDEFNTRFASAVVEPEEQAEITNIIQVAYRARRAEFAEDD